MYEIDASDLCIDVLVGKELAMTVLADSGLTYALMLAASLLTVGAMNRLPCASREEHGLDGSHAVETTMVCVPAVCNLKVSCSRWPVLSECTWLS